ncbi:hypothetical protein J1614_002977 [Plenodomus biglobosus]|nr:hypothetical protein J1614_002977 [Plenodomus biglobosus]
MRVIAFCALILSSVAAGRLFADDAYLQSPWDASTTADASPALLPHPDIPIQTTSAEPRNLELRQAPNLDANDAEKSIDPMTAQTSPANAATYVHVPTDAALPVPGAAFPVAAASLATPDAVNTAASTSQPPSLNSETNATPSATPSPIPPVNPIIAAVASTTTTPPSPPPPPGIAGDDYISVKWVETWIGGTSQTWVPKTMTIHFESRTPGPAPGLGHIGLGTIKGEAGRTKTVFVGAAATQGAVWAGGVAAAAAVGVGVVGFIG